MKVGIIGAGSIAGTMAGTIREMDCAQNYAVAARDYGRAAEICAKRMDFAKSLWILRGTGGGCPGWS